MNRGKWSQPGVPHKGWYLVDFEDLGDLDGTCQMCETMSIRYVHYMGHPDHPAVLGVGQVCASNMEEDYAAAQARERKVKNLARRRANWMSREWRVSRNDNHFINKDGFNIVLFDSYDGWTYQITSDVSERKWRASRFTTEDEAKLAAFERFEELKG